MNTRQQKIYKNIKYTKKQHKNTRTKHKRKYKISRRNNSKRNKMHGGFISCNNKVITEPGFNVPPYNKAPGLNIADSKVALDTSNQVKIDHPMIAT